ncbi:CopG family transcriptional regulator [uncultured Ruminococcus sp.]|uniref:CopG family transcriptional regulator n=1 Tax=uncultured Ruminococcus sp. TaxID=165186 RepID=UPI0025D52A81|nr:CopG family transcriptional regulator [uncultured Ruminococcus sp.]
MKEEIAIPQKYVEMIKKTAEQQGVSADDIVETEIKKLFRKRCRRCRMRKKA